MQDDQKLRICEELSDDGIPLGVEREEEEAFEAGALVEIDKPFDPEKIKVGRETKTVSLLSTRIEHGEIDLAPDFQRSPRIWDVKRKSRLIESLLLRIPLPAFYVASDDRENWAVVDGLQRLTTIQDFLSGRFTLAGLEYLVQLHGRKFFELPRNMQRRIEETELVLNVIQPGTPEDVMFNIFRRINTGGLALNGQEIRHALNKGPARAFLRDLASSGAFLDATAGSISDARMMGRECVLRFLAFWMAPWDTYDTSDLDGFLNSAMKTINRTSAERRNELSTSFDRAMGAASAVFGDDAFRKRYDPASPRNPISKALFEAWSVSLGRLRNDEIALLVDRSALVREKFLALMNYDRAFEVSVSYSTGSPDRVHKRFSAVEQLIREVLKDE